MITARQTSEQLGISIHTLRNWRAQGKGPRYYRQGASRVVYEPEDVDDWIAENYLPVELSPDADVMQEIIAKGYRALAFIAHPDRNGDSDSERMKKLNVARDRLLRLTGIG